MTHEELLCLAVLGSYRTKQRVDSELDRRALLGESAPIETGTTGRQGILAVQQITQTAWIETRQSAA